MFTELFNSSRFKSLLWRSGGMALAFLLTQITPDIQAMGISPEIKVFLGLLIGEVTKALNNYLTRE